MTSARRPPDESGALGSRLLVVARPANLARETAFGPLA
jgi:hypothetical protein